MDCTNVLYPVFLLVNDTSHAAGDAIEAAGGGNITLKLILTVVLIILNGFFVAAEFALVKVRLGQVKKMVDQGKPLSLIHI